MNLARRTWLKETLLRAGGALVLMASFVYLDNEKLLREERACVYDEPLPASVIEERAKVNPYVRDRIFPKNYDPNFGKSFLRKNYTK